MNNKVDCTACNIGIRIGFFCKVVFLLLTTLDLPAQVNSKSSNAAWTEKEHQMALAIRYGRLGDIKELVEEKKYPVNRRFPSGFTPLQCLIWFTAGRPDTAYYKYAIDYLIKKGASLQMKTPSFKKWDKLLAPYDSDGIKAASADSLNALQLAVLTGNIHVVKIMLQYDKNTYVKDKAGNTLLHLGAMYDYSTKYDEKYVVKLFDLLMMDRNVLNNEGQNPLVYYVSQPQWINTAKLVIDHMIKAGANPDQRDKSGKNYYDYGKTVNPWISDWIAQEAEWARVKKIIENFINTPPIDFEKQTQENLARYEAWKKRNGGCGSRELNSSFTLQYRYFLSSPYSLPTKGQKCSANDEPIEVVVTPDRISISTLSPYYGSFEVCESGITTLNGEQYELYTFRTNANNSTYTGFARKPGNSQNAIIFTQSGSILLGTSAFQYK
jgi:ankyrin repeat protein